LAEKSREGPDGSDGVGFNYRASGLVAWRNADQILTDKANNGIDKVLLLGCFCLIENRGMPEVSLPIAEERMQGENRMGVDKAEHKNVRFFNRACVRE
jgi:hypothetical protein